MFGTTYPIFEQERRTSESLRNRDLHDYVRWEYRPADRTSVILSARGGAVWAGRARTRTPRKLLRRFLRWAKGVRVEPILDEADAGLA